MTGYSVLSEWMHWFWYTSSGWIGHSEKYLQSSVKHITVQRYHIDQHWTDLKNNYSFVSTLQKNSLLSPLKLKRVGDDIHSLQCISWIDLDIEMYFIQMKTKIRLYVVENKITFSFLTLNISQKPDIVCVHFLNSWWRFLCCMLQTLNELRLFPYLFAV